MKTQATMYTVKPAQILDNALDTLYKGNYPEALHLFNMLLLLDPENKMAQVKRAVCLMYMGKHKTAKTLLSAMLEKGDNDAEVYFHLAELYKINMNYEAALTFTVKALEIDDHQASYLHLAAELCYLEKDYEEAFHFINKAIVESPFRKDLYYWRALIFNKFNKQDIAISDLNKALMLDPHYSDAYRLRAHCRMLNGDTEGYLADLKAAQRFDHFDTEHSIAA